MKSSSTERSSSSDDFFPPVFFARDLGKSNSSKSGSQLSSSSDFSQSSSTSASSTSSSSSSTFFLEADAFADLDGFSSSTDLVLFFFSFADFAISKKKLHRKISESFLLLQIFKKIFFDSSYALMI
ncbi:MAG: hypothetical protein FJX83_01740 [Bacteroidetes bacterium]|nr:hypothetical protein [Bacteroidota bacterium]